MIAVVVFDATFNNISVNIMMVSFIGGELTTDLPQVTDKLYHITFVSSTPRHERNSNSQC